MRTWNKAPLQDFLQEFLIRVVSRIIRFFKDLMLKTRGLLSRKIIQNSARQHYRKRTVCRAADIQLCSIPRISLWWLCKLGKVTRPTLYGSDSFLEQKFHMNTGHICFIYLFFPAARTVAGTYQMFNKYWLND